MCETEPNMTELINSLLKRLPHHRDKVQKLSGSNPAFDELCQEYNAVSERIDSASRSEPETSEDLGDLRRRRAAVEEQLIALMEANARV